MKAFSQFKTPYATNEAFIDILRSTPKRLGQISHGVGSVARYGIGGFLSGITGKDLTGNGQSKLGGGKVGGNHGNGSSDGQPINIVNSPNFINKPRNTNVNNIGGKIKAGQLKQAKPTRIPKKPKTGQVVKSTGTKALPPGSMSPSTIAPSVSSSPSPIAGVGSSLYSQYSKLARSITNLKNGFKDRNKPSSIPLNKSIVVRPKPTINIAEAKQVYNALFQHMQTTQKLMHRYDQLHGNKAHGSMTKKSMLDKLGEQISDREMQSVILMKFLANKGLLQEEITIQNNPTFINRPKNKNINVITNKTKIVKHVKTGERSTSKKPTAEKIAKPSNQKDNNSRKSSVPTEPTQPAQHPILAAFAAANSRPVESPKTSQPQLTSAAPAAAAPKKSTGPSSPVNHKQDTGEYKLSKPIGSTSNRNMIARIKRRNTMNQTVGFAAAKSRIVKPSEKKSDSVKPATPRKSSSIRKPTTKSSSSVKSNASAKIKSKDLNAKKAKIKKDLMKIKNALKSKSKKTK
jgi:hypothetical protein